MDTGCWLKLDTGHWLQQDTDWIQDCLLKDTAGTFGSDTVLDTGYRHPLVLDSGPFNVGVGQWCLSGAIMMASWGVSRPRYC